MSIEISQTLIEICAIIGASAIIAAVATAVLFIVNWAMGSYRKDKGLPIHLRKYYECDKDNTKPTEAPIPMGGARIEHKIVTPKKGRTIGGSFDIKPEGRIITPKEQYDALMKLNVTEEVICKLSMDDKEKVTHVTEWSDEHMQRILDIQRGITRHDVGDITMKELLDIYQKHNAPGDE